MNFRKWFIALFLLIFANVSYAGFRAVTPMEISMDSPVTLKNTGATLIGKNVSTSKLLFVYEIVIFVNNAAGVVTPATISIGTNASNYNNILPATLLTASATGEYTLKIPAGTVVPVATGADIFVNVTVGANATTYSARIAVEGIPT